MGMFDWINGVLSCHPFCVKQSSKLPHVLDFWVRYLSLSSSDHYLSFCSCFVLVVTFSQNCFSSFRREISIQWIRSSLVVKNLVWLPKGCRFEHQKGWSIYNHVYLPCVVPHWKPIWEVLLKSRKIIKNYVYFCNMNYLWGKNVLQGFIHWD